MACYILTKCRMGCVAWLLVLLYVNCARAAPDRSTRHTTGALFRVVRAEWTMAINSHMGNLEAEIEVQEGVYLSMRWYKATPLGYLVPIAGNMEVTLNSFEWWSQGVRHLTSLLQFHPVPYQETLELTLEVVMVDGGAAVRHTMVIRPSQGFPVTEQWHATTLALMETSGPTVSFTSGNPVELSYTVTSSGPLEVASARFQTPSDAATALFSTYSLEEADIHLLSDSTVAGDDGLATTELRVAVSAARERHQGRVEIVLVAEDGSVLTLRTQLLHGATPSMFQGQPSHVLLTACDPDAQGGEPGSDDDDVTVFNFQSGADQCVSCRAASFPMSQMHLFHNGFPVGSGGMRSVLWYQDGMDLVTLEFPVNRIDRSYQGRYTCVATTDDHVLEVPFEIRVE